MIRSASITVVGAGDVGANIAYLLSERHIADRVLIYDPNVGQGVGKALDIAEALPIRRRRVAPLGIDSLEQLAGSDIIVWSLEQPHPALKDSGTPYTTESEVQKFIPFLSDYTGILIVAARAGDSLVQHLVSQSAMPPRSVIGLGTLPATRRLRHALATSAHIDEKNVEAVAIGSASQPYPVHPLLTISGIPADLIVDRSVVNELCVHCESEERVFKDPFFVAGVATELIEAVVYDLRRLFPVATDCSNHKEITGVVSLPAVIGASGALRTVEPPMSPEMRAAFLRSIGK